MSETTCWCVMSRDLPPGEAPYKVFIDKEEAFDYVVTLNNRFCRHYNVAQGPFYVEECEIALNEKVCYCVIISSPDAGTSPYSVFLSKEKAQAYVGHLNSVYKNTCLRDGPYFVEECDFDGDLGEVSL